MKTMKDFAAQQLSKKQMNQVRGGANSSNLCNPGERLYTCTMYINGEKTSSTGSVCGYSAANAENRALASLLTGPVGDYSFKCE